jgi:excisionase family DNA binding protein
MDKGADKLLLTIPEAAERLAISRTTLYELIGAKQLRVVRIGQRGVRVPVAELAAWVARSVAGADASPISAA